MQKDSRKGHGEWTGCYTFEDIICDGDVSDIHEKRTGGLKMGGTYWYYVRVTVGLLRFLNANHSRSTASMATKIISTKTSLPQAPAHSYLARE
jgi:hypothetical protein